MMRTQLNTLDRAILHFDTFCRTVFGVPKTSGRAMPGAKSKEAALSDAQTALVAALMRVNHAGEVAAQALYEGQALTAKNPDIVKQMQTAAIEENDHLHWCATRLTELGSHTSYLNLFWYTGALSIGLLAGLAGDAWNLGFLAETEKQVSQHLEKHLAKLPKADLKTHAILTQMQIDEAQHAKTAETAGARVLPTWLQGMMRLSSKVMTTLAYWI